MTTTLPESNSDDYLNSNERWFPSLSTFFMEMGRELMEEIHYVEQFFIKIHSIYAFVCQICFFILFDAATDKHPEFDESRGDKSVVIALSSILFYSVFAYFVSRMRDVWQTNRVRPILNFSNRRLFLQWMCKILIEWAKAVVIVMCLREQGIYYEPKLIYSIATFIYYLCSEKIFLQIIPELVEILNIESLENLEHLYVPMALNFVAIAAATVTIFYLLLFKYSHFILLTVYFVIYLRIKDVYHNNWKTLRAERQTYRSFRVATKEDIQEWADICAVCLCSMSSARITPCNHLFHPHCLKQCLKTSFYCPLCKRHFMERSEIK
nr:RING finger protein 145-like isoform X1 [Leptinotarsa decemlineata]